MSSQIPSLSQSMLALYGPELKLQSASYAVCIHQIMVGNYLEELLHWQYASIKHMWLAKNIYIHTHTLGSWMLKLINYLLRKKSPWIFICYTKPIVLIHTWPTDPNRYIIVSPVPSAVGDDQYESKATPLTCQPHKELNKLVMIIHNESTKNPPLLNENLTHELWPSPHATTFRSSMLQTWTKSSSPPVKMYLPSMLIDNTLSIT